MKAREAWDKKVASGDKVTCISLLVFAGEKRTKASVSRFSSFLGRMVKKGEAVKVNEVDSRGLFYYRKAGAVQKRAKPRTEKHPLTQEFNLLQLGESILAVINDHKIQIRVLQDALKQANAGINCLVDQKRKLEELYTQAQEKIIALNSGKGKTIKLHELQAIRDCLPAKEKF